MVRIGEQANDRKVLGGVVGKIDGDIRRCDTSRPRADRRRG